MIKKKIPIVDILRNVSLVSYLCLSPFISTLIQFGASPAIYRIVSGLLSYGFLLIFFILNPKKIPLDFIVVLAFLFLNYFVVLEMYKDDKDVIDSVMWTRVLSLSGSGVLGYAFIRSFDSSLQMRKCLLIAAIINLVFYIFRGISALKNGGWVVLDEDGITRVYSSDMNYGYQLLFCFAVFLYWCFYSKLLYKFVFGILLAVIAVMDLLLGSRGSLLSMAVCVVLFFVFSNKKKTIKRIFSLVFIIGVFLVAFSFVKPLLDSISDAFHYSSRSITMLLSGEATDSNGRDSISADAFKYIALHPIIGNGIFSDRVYLGTYCHNLFLELFFDFGILVGSLLILLLIVVCFRALTSNDKHKRLLFICFFSLWCTRLLISNSLWIDPFFWMSMAILFQKNQARKFNFKLGGVNRCLANC